MGIQRHLMFDWTDQRCDDLRRLYADGLSSSQIANELGDGLTRNSVIGKVNRLGLTRDSHPSSANRPAHPRHRKPAKPRGVKLPPTASTRHTRVAAWRMALMPEQPVMDVVDDSAIPLEQRCTLEQLTNSTCRWPVGDPATPDFFFCGHPSADNAIGIPYCAAHGKRASAGPGRAPDRYPWGRGRE